MRRVRRALEGTLIAGFIGLVAACGSTIQIPQAPVTGPLSASPLAVTTTGNAAASIDPRSVTFGIDGSGSLVAHLTVTSAAPNNETVTIRGSLLDSTGKPIGDVTGGAINLNPGSSQQVELTGPAPNGTIVSVTFEISTQPAPTATAQV
jgi:archaellum component FlaG (FlaF/FlaG flagellin family)